MRIFPPPLKWLLMLESRAFIELASFYAALPKLRKAPRGDGHPVLVLPGFMASSRSTIPLRNYLAEQGYAAHRWKLGRNLGYRPEFFEAVMERLAELHQRYGRRVSLIGWSLGGVFAREAAREHPDMVRQVLTMGSPFQNGAHSNNVRWLYELIAGHSLDDVDQTLLERMKEPPPVPSTALYTRYDGVVAWQTTIERLSVAHVQNIHVGGGHFGLGFNPRAVTVIANRLSQPADAWQPLPLEGLAGQGFETHDAAKLHHPPQAASVTRRLQATLNELQAHIETARTGE